MYLSSNRAFTLVEMMVVISIISLLSSVAFAGFTSIRIEAKNNARYDQINKIKDALEIYNEDNGIYPHVEDNGIAISDNPTTWNKFVSDLSPYVDNLKPLYNEQWPYSSYYYRNFPEDLTVDKVHAMYPVAGGYGCIDFYPNSFYLYTYPLRYPTTESKNDNGINTNLYEKFGGRYDIVPCPH